MTTALPRRQLFGVDGLWCGSCAGALQRRLSELPGVSRAAVHFLTRSAFVEWDTVRVDEATIAERVADAGYRLVPQPDAAGMREELARARRSLLLRLVVGCFFAMWSMMPALVLYVAPPENAGTRWWLAMLSGLLAVPVLAFSASDLLRMAIRSVRLKAPSFDLLVAIGVTASIAASIGALAKGRSDVFFDAAAMLVVVFLAARLIDLSMRGSALDAIDALNVMGNETALLATGESRSVGGISLGTRIVVEAGAEVPMDGILEGGDSSIDVSLLTGEAIPVRVVEGDRVPAGALNLRRAIALRTDRLAGDRDIDRIGGRVALELAARSSPHDPLELLARRLCLAIPMIGLLVTACWSAVGGDWAVAWGRGLATMIVLCPCALVLARPLVGMTAVTAAAAKGIRVVDPGALEVLARVRTVLFDKTGTLTQGQLRVDAALSSPGWTSEEVLEAAACAEAGIDHPIARAFRTIAGVSVASGERHPRGASGIWRGRPVDVRAHEGEDSRTALEVMVAGETVGVVYLVDEPRVGVSRIIERLSAENVTTGIASGDHRGPVDWIGDVLGIQAGSRHARLTPQDKADLIHASVRPVAFVGDGVNDAPAFAASDVGIAVASAHAAARRTAQIVLDDGPEGLLVARGIGQRMSATVRFLLVSTVAYNAIAGTLAVTGFVTPVAAASLMTANSLLTALISRSFYGITGSLGQGPTAEIGRVQAASSLPVQVAAAARTSATDFRTSRSAL